MKKSTHNSPKVNPSTASCRTRAGNRYGNPLDYDHPYPSMRRFAELLNLRHDANRTRHAYYRDMRLVHQHFGCDPETLGEGQLRDYLLHVKNAKGWKPKTIRQTVASAKIFFLELLGHDGWKVFSQIVTKDHDELPVVLSRAEVRALLAHVRLRRYRTPLKLIYTCGLRLSECLSLTVHDIKGGGTKLWVRGGKGGRDRMLPLPAPMVEDLRSYWKFHQHRLLLFPSAGRGPQSSPEKLAARMRAADGPMPVSSLQRLLLVAREELKLPGTTVHTLRHSFATHMVEAGASLHTVQALLGHKQIDSTMVYLHLTHHSEENALRLMEGLCEGLPR